MKTTTAIEVKCERKIPFHSELTGYLQKLSGSTSKTKVLSDIPHKDAIVQAIREKLLFISIRYSRPVKNRHPKLLTYIKKALQKDLVGTIKVGADEITFILI